MTGTNDKQSLEQLQRLAVATEKEVEEIRAEIAPLENRLGAARERLDLVQRLIRLTERDNNVPRGISDVSKQRSSESVARPLPAKQDLEVHLEQVLRDAAKPMHISEIRRALVDRAASLPGRGDEANIIVRLRRAPELFTRTGRGMYALASLGLNTVPPEKRKRRVRTRRVA